MHVGPFRFGMRTFKSALSVLICILLFHFLNRGQPLIAALSAVFSLRQDLSTTLDFGKSRILGNILGGGAAILYLLLQNQFATNNFWIELIALPTLVAVVITFSDGIDNNAGIISAIATLLLITLSIPPGESVGFAFDRILDTFIGTLVAIGLNFVIRPPKMEAAKEIVTDLALLKEQEIQLEKELKNVQEQIKEQAVITTKFEENSSEKENET